MSAQATDNEMAQTKPSIEPTIVRLTPDRNFTHMKTDVMPRGYHYRARESIFVGPFRMNNVYKPQRIRGNGGPRSNLNVSPWTQV